MDNNEFEQLSSLWQSTEQKSLPHMDKLIKRHKRHGFILKLNIVIECVAILAVSSLFLMSLIEKASLIKQIWVGFATIWGITLFVLMSKSRLSSLKHLKSEQLSSSIEAHKKLLKNEIFRWDLSIKATCIFVIAMSVFAISKCVFAPCDADSGLHIVISFLVLGVAQSVFFVKRRAAKRVLFTLEQ
ncbi:hypothetical protein J8M20_13850 [Pseudoalteromonas luteoviolacea]|uniref:hypothetical protein n=1 Tax=Pseudoalteromonas luteoviolacea TaxID=43657 RepID=UPI001B369E8E|nr:hypothetical protein [Pseudoalteromonas luteoviolacea]MBQ4812436.1 hypothetical protein [Pseudoalteromonas luteoviolacea]